MIEHFLILNILIGFLGNTLRSSSSRASLKLGDFDSATIKRASLKKLNFGAGTSGFYPISRSKARSVPRNQLIISGTCFRCRG